MNLEVRTMLTRYQDLKVRGCERKGGPVDLAPMLDIEFDDGNHAVAVIVSRDQLEPLLREAIEQTAREGIKPVRLAFMADIVFKVGDAAEAATGLDKTDPTLRTGIYATVLEADGSTLHGAFAYVYDDAGQPQFSEDEQVTAMLDDENAQQFGELHEILKEAVR